MDFGEDSNFDFKLSSDVAKGVVINNNNSIGQSHTFELTSSKDSKELILRPIKDFTTPKRIYGRDLIVKRDRVLNKYKSTTTTLGVLAVGEKGSGKSLLLQMISILAWERYQLNTVVIADDSLTYNKAGELLLDYISKLPPCVIIIDEFEKIFNIYDQKRLLTLMSGLYATRKIFLLSANDKNRIDQHMLNRPERIRYYYQFSGVGEDYIREFCEERLNDNISDRINKNEEINDIVSIAKTFSAFNHDMLQALVEEINEFKEPAYTAVKYLNINPENANKMKWSIGIFDKDNKPFQAVNPNVHTKHPLDIENLMVSYSDGNSPWNSIVLTSADYVDAQNENTIYVYKQGDVTVKFIKVEDKIVDYLTGTIQTGEKK